MKDAASHRLLAKFKFDHIHLCMCILLKLHYAKFGLSNLFFSKVIEEKPLGVDPLSPPPLVKEWLRPCSHLTGSIIGAPRPKIASDRHVIHI